MRWETQEQEGIVTLVIVPGVKLSLRVVMVNQYGGVCQDGIEFHLSFEDPKIGTKFREAVLKARFRDNILPGPIEWEKAVNIECGGVALDHNAKALLGERLINVSSWGSITRLRLSPHAEEKLVVYGDREITRDLGLEVRYERGMVRHPDPRVFLSVGPFSMRIERSVNQRGRTIQDMLIVFVDDLLPIQPQPEEVDEEDSEDYGYEPSDALFRPKEY
jgi:hypothetical protein